MSTPAHEIVTTRIVNATKALAFKAWTDPDHLKNWWGPNGFTNTFHEYDLKPGGKWRFIMHGPNGSDHPNESEFIKIDPPSYISWFHISAPPFTVVATFDELSFEKTKVTFRMIFDSIETLNKLKAFVTEKNEENMDRLETELSRMKTQKANGSVTALLAEYEKVISELQQVINNITSETLRKIADTETTNENCRSIQTVLTHVVSAGYSYCIYIREATGQPAKKRELIERETAEQYQLDLDNVFKYTCATFEDISTADLYDLKFQIKTSWDKTYDIEQLIEHAIVHIMRHRRQVEKFKLKVL